MNPWCYNIEVKRGSESEVEVGNEELSSDQRMAQYNEQQVDFMPID